MTKADAKSSLAEATLLGDPRALARAATLIEAGVDAGRELISALFDKTGRATIVGITGPPGAGKSTLVNQMTRLLRSQGRKVGIIAVDPSSPHSRGAILGDRIRLTEHYRDPEVFVRSMATRGKLGGLAQGTLETALLLDAAGFDVILIETVGVGQGEVDIAALADVTVVVFVPGLGDDIQAMKAGIMEIADVLVINKADLPGANELERDLRFTQTLSRNRYGGEAAPILRVVASEGTGIGELVSAVESVSRTRSCEIDRTQLWSARLREMLRESVLMDLDAADLKYHGARVAGRLSTPYEAVAALRSKLLEKRA